jgi:hypothetical protein
MKRRTLLQSIATVLFTGPFGRITLGGQAAATAPTAPTVTTLTASQVATLKAVAAVVLPGAIGDAGRTAAVDRFVQWVKDYREGADRGHSYGSSTLSQRSGPSPAAKYPAQFEALDEQARARGSASFAALAIEQRREILEAALDQPPRVTNLPGRPNGANLVADFMGYYFTSGDGYDLAYEAAIGRDICRGLEGSDRAPAPLRKG